MMKALIARRLRHGSASRANVLESFKTVFHKDPPAELVDACNAAKPACN